MDVLLPKSGRYVVAISGGVDSVTLLDILVKHRDLKLTIAHVDHGIRTDSVVDRTLVESQAGTQNVPFIYVEAKLGKGASEAKAREVRYRFLREVMEDTGSTAIITAHHQDDLIETAILNMLRGTGRKGISAMESQPDVIRPLLGVSKAELINYAKKNKLAWREDSTNSDENYLRNYVRRNITPKLTTSQRQAFLGVIQNMRQTNSELDTLLAKHLLNQSADGHIDRDVFNKLPHDVAKEVMATWLRSNEVRDFDKRMLERLVVAAKTGAAGKQFPVLAGYSLRVNKGSLALVGPER